MTPINRQKVDDWLARHHVPCPCGNKEVTVGSELVYLSNRSLAAQLHAE